MKKTKLLLLTLILTLSSQAQLFKYGAEAGLNLSDIKTDNFDG